MHHRNYENLYYCNYENLYSKICKLHLVATSSSPEYVSSYGCILDLAIIALNISQIPKFMSMRLCRSLDRRFGDL
jgi:hypothetical protein